MIRIRIQYAKTEALRYTSNLDVQKIWERTLRRAKLPLAYSQGFHPQPRINLASPLPLGITSRAELMEFWLEEDLAFNDIEAKLVKALPPGLEIIEMRFIDMQDKKVQTLVLSSEYDSILLQDTLPDEVELAEKIETILKSSQLLRERRGKKYDLRPLIKDIQPPIRDEEGRMHISMHLWSRPEEATGRPDEVLSALEINPGETRVERTRLYLKPDSA